HGRYGARLGSVPRSGDLIADLVAVVLVERAEQLGVGVEVLLARIRVRGIHVRSDRVGDGLPLGAVLSPIWDRIAQLLADHPLEGLAIVGSVQVAQKVV